MADKKFLILRVLMDNSRGLYGAEFANGGQVKRGTIYATLARLVAGGYVREVEEPPTSGLQMKRTRYFITAKGQRTCRMWAQDMGVEIKDGALTRGGK